VLFCRRRDCLCNIDAPPAPARAFQVWAIDLAGIPWNDSTRKAILANPAEFTPTKIDVIDFPAGSYELKNAAKAPQRWTAVIKDPGYVIQWAGIAMSGIPDASWLESNRLDAYEAAIGSVASSVPGAALREVMSYVPQGLAVPGTDGILLVVIANQTVPVYRLRPSEGGIAFLKSQTVSFHETGPADYLDSVVLTRPSGFMDSALTTSWKAHHDGPPYGYMVVLNPNAQGIDQIRLETRAKDLVAELDGTLWAHSTRNDSGAGWPLHGSDAALVLLPWVLVVVYQESSEADPSKSLSDRIKIPTTKKLGVGRFQPDSTWLDNGPEFKFAWQGTPGTIRNIDAYVSSRTNDDYQIGLIQKTYLPDRVLAITTALGLKLPPSPPPPINNESVVDDLAFDEAPFFIFIRA
jgi:hypothetical protein